MVGSEIFLRDLNTWLTFDLPVLPPGPLRDAAQVLEVALDLHPVVVSSQKYIQLGFRTVPHGAIEQYKFKRYDGTKLE